MMGPMSPLRPVAEPRDTDTCARLEERLKTLLPQTYQKTYESVQPASMGSAGLKYDAEGAVAWDQIWGSFCDLAMAGGPPHKGTFLEAGREDDINADFARYDAVVEEICRGIKLVTGLRAYASPTPGWVSVTCTGDTMADWLLRAIVMENVAARRTGAVLELPAAPRFRVEKEIKNVITVIAKTCHYWMGHVPASQQREIGDLFMRMTIDFPLVAPGDATDELSATRMSQLSSTIAARIERETPLRRSGHAYAEWVGLDCRDVPSAVWMMRALVASNVLSRRENRTLFVPVNPSSDPNGAIVGSAAARVHRYAVERNVIQS
jgi:sirohydrochlorin cobaltochelatase